MPELLLLGKPGLMEWQQRAAGSHAGRYARLLNQADSYLVYLPPGEHPSETITYQGMAAANLGLAYLLSEKHGYLEALRRWVGITIRYPHWGKAHMPDQDLDAGWISFGLSLAYNWVGKALPPEERDALRDKLILQGTRLYDFAVQSEGRWWSSAYWQNHNWICYAGLAAVGFALEKEYPPAGAWSQRAVENFRKVMSLLPEDGSDYEGPVYWCYGVPWLFTACDLIQQQTGEDLHSAFLRNTFYYRMAVSAPDLVSTANFGDCHDRRSAHSAAMLYRMAGAFNLPQAAWLADEFSHTGEWEREGREGLLRPGIRPQAFLEFLWYTPEVQGQSLHSLPRVQAFADLGLVSMRTSWEKDATFLALKCGAPSGHKAQVIGDHLKRQAGWQSINAGHAHPDENSFILVRGSDYLAVDEGYSMAKSSRNHSTVLVDGKGQYNEGGYNIARDLPVERRGQFESYFTAAGMLHIRAQARSAYQPELELTDFTRQVLFGGEHWMLVCDDLASSLEHDYCWQLQTDQPAQANLTGGFDVLLPHTRFSITALLPRGNQQGSSQTEIVAYPSSSTPEWVLRHEQHTLAIHPPEPTATTRFVVALTYADPGDTPATCRALDCQGGSAVKIDHPGGAALAVFSNTGGILRVEDLSVEGEWALVEQQNEELRLACGQTTRLEWNGRLYLAADLPVNAGVRYGAHPGATCWEIQAAQPTWASLYSPIPPDEIRCDGALIAPAFDQRLGCVRLSIPAGTHEIHIQ